MGVIDSAALKKYESDNPINENKYWFGAGIVIRDKGETMDVFEEIKQLQATIKRLEERLDYLECYPGGPVCNEGWKEVEKVLNK